jgi:hypothetical protein
LQARTSEEKTIVPKWAKKGEGTQLSDGASTLGVRANGEGPGRGEVLNRFVGTGNQGEAGGCGA